MSIDCCMADHITNTGRFVWLRQENGMLDCHAADLRADAKMSECISDCCMGLVLALIQPGVGRDACKRRVSVQ